MFLEVEQVGFVYQTPSTETEALKDVSFAMEEGEFVSLVGPSGCGKSTLLSILVGLEQPTAGSVRLREQSISAGSGTIGYMPQDAHLFPWRSVRDNIALGLEIQKKMDAEHLDAAERLMKRYGLWDAADRFPGQLSGGMKQRCALIRSLVTDPAFLVLDESFSALDYQTRIAVSVDIRSIIKKENKTALLVTHDISESVLLSDRVLVMSKNPGSIKAVHDLCMFREISPLDRPEQVEYHATIKRIWRELDANVGT